MFLPNISIAEIAPSGMKEFNKICPAQKLCPDLENYYQACNKKPDTEICKKFIEAMKQLSPVYDCQRPFDNGYIVPAIWLCGEKRRESGASFDETYYELLSKLKLKEATEYFTSPLFRSVLDGHMAEEYYDKSERLEKKLKKKKMK
jgi:hypothetical protein